MKYIQVAVFLSKLLVSGVFAETTPSVEVSGNPAPEGGFQKAEPELYHLRESMTDTSLGFRDRYSAAEQLLAQGDEQAVRRLVYGLKTGNRFSAQVLIDHAPLSALTYMVEDIDHGIQTNMIGADDPGDVYFPSVKNFATQIALKSLANSKILPELTRRFFNHLSEVNYQRPGYFNDEFSEIIVDWWSHNKESLMARRYVDATWLPDETPVFLTREERNPNPPPPPPPTPAELAIKKKVVMDETFEQWVDRVAVLKEIRIFHVRSSRPSAIGREDKRDSRFTDDSRNAASSAGLDRHGLPRWINAGRALAVIITLMVALGSYRFFKARHRK